MADAKWLRLISLWAPTPFQRPPERRAQKNLRSEAYGKVNSYHSFSFKTVWWLHNFHLLNLRRPRSFWGTMVQWCPSCPWSPGFCRLDQRMWQDVARVGKWHDNLTTLLEKGWFTMVYVTLGWLQFSMMAFIQAYGLPPVVTMERSEIVQQWRWFVTRNSPAAML